MFSESPSVTLAPPLRQERAAAQRPTVKLTASVWLTKVRSVAAFLFRGFEVDLRSLAAFRIGLGIMALANVVVALTNAEVFYSDAGAYPRALLLGRQWESDGLWSLHVISGSVWFQVGLLVIQGAAALAMIAGYRTRMAVLVSWVLAISLEGRNPAISNGSDAVMRLLLFWSLFLPLAARWSVDNFKAGVRAAQSRLLNVATVALLLQIACIYTFAALLKMKGWDLWFVQGKALLLALQLDTFTTPLGLWLRHQEVLCQWLCRATFVLEIAGPALALLPVLRTQLKIAMALSFVALHAGIAATMDIGAFPWLMMAAWCVVLPAEFWNWLGRVKWVQGLVSRISTSLPQSQTRAEACPEHVRYGVKPSWWLRGFASVCLMYVLLWNLRGVNFAYWEQVLPKSLNGFAFVFRLDQYWTMFAPQPMLEDGWIVMQADLSDGSQVDLLARDGELRWDKPALPSADYKDSRWQKYLMNLWERKYGQHRVWMGNYLAEKWNATHGGFSQVSAWEMFYMMEPTNMDGTVGEVQKISLWKCQSYAGKE